MSYADFIARKKQSALRYGFEPSNLNSSLKDWQATIANWSVRRGRAAVFADTGLGKTLMQLAWAEQIASQGMPVIVLCPLGVRMQTLHEAEKFGIGCSVQVVEKPSGVAGGINLCNYEKLHLFDDVRFGGVVLDESSILKSLAGKTRTKLIERFAGCHYRLACTATPAPNDHMELGNHAEFLNVMASSDMLNRFFYHDSANTAKWCLRPHGREEYWDWVASWGVCIEKPSDIGGDDDGYDLPPIRTHRHVVEIDHGQPTDGMLFNVSGISAANIFEEKRLTMAARVSQAATIANSEDSPCVIWCDTNDESSALAKAIVGSVEIKGNDKTEQKEAALEGFQQGQFQKLVTKASICGMGLNWQHCNRMVFAGLTYSFERYYQAVRRIWRFGQTQECDIHIVLADSESGINSALARKEADFGVMRSGMADAMRRGTLEQLGLDSGKQAYAPQKQATIPGFMENNYASQ